MDSELMRSSGLNYFEFAGLFLLLFVAKSKCFLHMSLAKRSGCALSATTSAVSYVTAATPTKTTTCSKAPTCSLKNLGLVSTILKHLWPSLWDRVNTAAQLQEPWKMRWLKWLKPNYFFNKFTHVSQVPWSWISKASQLRRFVGIRCIPWILGLIAGWPQVCSIKYWIMNTCGEVATWTLMIAYFLHIGISVHGQGLTSGSTLAALAAKVIA